MKVVLFACVHNAGFRSQMSAAWFNALCSSPSVSGSSAGTEPAESVHPVVIEAMREVGIDLSSAKPQKLTKELAEHAFAGDNGLRRGLSICVWSGEEGLAHPRSKRAKCRRCSPDP